MEKNLGQRVIEFLADSLTRNPRKDSLSEANCVASKYMQRVLKRHNQIMQKNPGKLYDFPYEIYFAHTIN